MRVWTRQGGRAPRWIVSVAAVCVLAGGVTAAQQQPGGAESSAQRSAPSQPTRVFASDAGIVLNFIKPDKTADFEMSAAPALRLSCVTAAARGRS